MTLFTRLPLYVLDLLVAIDCLAQTLIVGAWWAAGFGKHRPHTRETISGYLGRKVAAGRQWAVLPAALVDALFLVLTVGVERWHCSKVAEGEATYGIR